MRTTVRIDDALYRRVKARAAQTGRTTGEVIEDALRMVLRPPGRAEVELPPLPVFGGGGVLPGVDLASNAALRERMDEDTGIDALR
jgi:Arc/MetJ family transcription regulator